MERDATPDLPEDTREGSPETASDPFGSLFATDPEPEGEGGADGAGVASRPVTRRPASWVASLPRFTRAEALLSRALSAAAPALSEGAVEAVALTLARYTRQEPGAVKFAPLGLSEAEAPQPPGPRDDHPRVYAALTVEPGAARVVAETSALFAAAVVDLALGGEGAEPDSLRDLSATETAVVEFLWLALARELNELAGGALWRVDSVGATQPRPTPGRRPAVTREAIPVPGAPSRALVTPVGVELGSLKGLVNFYFDEETLRALDASGNSLLRPARPGARASAVREVRLAVLVGETELSVAEVALLEAGDVVLVTRPRVERSGEGFAGRVRLSAGAGDGLVIVCEVAGNGAPLNWRVVTVEAAGAARTAERSEMNEEQLNEDEAPNEEALAALMLTVRVELAARRMSLDELSRLRPGQLLDLGVRPTDPVNLMHDDQRVARGELVDFEGQLGVRITQVP